MASALACPHAAQAAPQTYFDTFASVTGPVASGRFGSALDCSDGANSGDISHFAVGAPDASGSQGAVYIYSVADPPTLVQTLTSQLPGNNQKFGSAVAFTSDINGDGKDDLVVGEPGAAIPIIWGYFSQPNGTYSSCGSYQSPSSSLGSVLLGQRVLTGTTLSHVIAGLPDTGETRALAMTLVAPGVCGFSLVSAHSHAMGTGSFGAALAETNSDVDSDGESDILVGAPSESSDGGSVYLSGFGTSPFMAGSLAARAGAAVAAELTSVYLAVGSPGANSGVGKVGIYARTASPPLMCEVTRTGDGASAEFGKALRHLKNPSFAGLFTGADAVYATYRSESSTGGSVGIFFQAASLCTEPYQYNNCVQDQNQEQGTVLGGGSTCTGQIAPGGSNFGVHPILIVGSPGFQNGRGRIDIVSEMSERASPSVCGAGNPTPTPTPTPTATSTPVIIQPGSKIPKAKVVVVGKTAKITAPKVVPRLSAASRKKAIALLIKKGLSKAAAIKALQKLKTMYVFVYTKKPGTKEASVFGEDVELLGRSSIIRNRNNQISLRNLPPGQYSVSWRAEISTQQPPVSIGNTSTSPPTSFTIRR